MSLAPDAIVEALPGLYRYALALTGDPGRADDLVQETALRALESGAGFRGDSSPRTWLHTILYRVFLDSVRRRREWPADASDVGEAIEAAWRDDRYTVDPAAIMLRARERATLLDALSRLPHILRSALILHDVEGLTAAAVAEVHQLSLAAAKQRIRRGRAHLVSALDGEDRRALARGGVPMNCWEARSQVGEYLEDELGAAERAVLEAHLAGCPTCPSLYAALVGVRDCLGELRDRDNVVPPELAARVRERLDGPA